MKKAILDRYLILVVLFAGFGMLILYNLYNLQIVNGLEHFEDSQNKIRREKTIPAPRGKIYDRNNVPAAVIAQGFEVHLVKSAATVREKNEAISKLVDILEKNGDKYSNSLCKYLSFAPMEFDSNKDIAAWMKKFFYEDEIEAEEMAKKPYEFFNYLREECFEIDSSYSDEEAYKIMRIRYEIHKNSWFFSRFNPLRISTDTSLKSVAEIEERHHEMPGVTTEVVPVREYNQAYLAPHIIGYMGSISPDQLKNWSDYNYAADAIVGKAGVEFFYQHVLRGREGKSKIEVDKNGRLTDVLKEEPAIPGNDLVLTIDMELQKVAYDSLEKTIKQIVEKKDGKRNFGDAFSGTAIAMKIDTGEIIAMASYPGYDPSFFLDLDAKKQKQVKIWISDHDNKPTMNRATQITYAPGSTYKPLVAIAALEEGVITPSTVIRDNGKVEYDGHVFYCLESRSGHGDLVLETALATSCNIFFHIIGVDTTINKIDKWAKLFGLGEKTGFELYEKKGIRANREYKYETFKEDWWPANTAMSAIGQLYNEFTPLQLAVYISAIANGGRLYKPYVVDRVLRYDGVPLEITRPEYKKIPVKDTTLDAVKKGMKLVTQSVDGTAEKVFRDFPVKVAGKTGTAETGREKYGESSDALFVCYAPAEKPEIAVVVVVEKGVWGSYTAPIAKDLLTAYFGIEKDSGE